MSNHITSSPPYATDGEKWIAVFNRMQTADGAFFYAVQTTGIYCRPSCSARRPKRENVQFYTTAFAAEKAGFRPCRRCRPDDLSHLQMHAKAVAKACKIISTAEETPNLRELANAVHMSSFHFHRVFKAMTGLTPKAYAVAYRSQKLRRELKQTTTVTEAIYNSGFHSNSPFYATSSKALGMKPSEFRKGGENLLVYFAVGDCSLGAILVAMTKKGLCSIALGDDPDALVRDLQDMFPKAQLVGADPEFEHFIARVIGFVESPTDTLDLPLDVQGTIFQQRVWRALCDIPAGSTASYADIAKHIGAPHAVRAVARACATNRIALAIPCHRVIRHDGGLAGYRWGVERKRALLNREAAETTKASPLPDKSEGHPQ